jgi:methionyl-tRNA formyltransferase
VFAGTPEFAAKALHAIIHSRHEVCAVYTQPDRPAGRGRKLTASPVKKLAQEHGIPVEQPPSLKPAEVQTQLADWGADVMVVAAYGLILPAAVLEIPRLGCINIHASLLPRWRGAAPIQRAILAGDTETGVTIMQMDEGLDTGAMLYRLTTPITGEDTGGSVHVRLAELGAEAILIVLEQLAGGTAVAEDQYEGDATYASKLHKREAVLDWQESAVALWRRVCAFNPWPVTQTQLDTRVVRIWEAQALDEQPVAQPGEIVAVTRDGVDVRCASGVLRLTKLQVAGGKPLAAAEFLNGHPELLKPGLRFGAAQ